MQNIEFKYNIQIGSKNIRVRKWKVKDRMSLKLELKKISEPQQVLEIIYKHLLWNCFQNPVALNKDEIEVAFIKMRELNIGSEILYKRTCPSCYKKIENQIMISDILETSYGELKDISVQGIEIKLSDVKNINFYNKEILKSEDPLVFDLCMHIEAINSDNTMDLKTLMKYFENLDISIMDEILDQYESMIFKISSRNKTLECPECKHLELYEFDEIPELIPKKWFSR